jgi:hypothetical protein
MDSFVASESAMQLQSLLALLVCNTFDCLAAPDFDKPIVFVVGSAMQIMFQLVHMT